MPRIDPFNPDELGMDSYLALFDAHMQAHSITDNDKKKALLLCSLGIKSFAILVNLTAPDMPADKTYAQLCDILKSHYVSKPSYHRSLHLFQNRRKMVNESLNDLYADLKRLADDCIV